MPKTKLQNVIFTLIMAFVMVYAMVCYNISIDKGGMSNQIFLLAFYEMPIMWPAAFILEFFVVEKLSKFLAFRIVSPTDKPIFIILAISSMIVCLMCPAMSFIAAWLYYPYYEGFNFITLLANWLKLICTNFPFAFFSQLFFIQPLIRTLFKKIFRRNKAAEANH